ncbi:hypothetical protein Verru16b_02535 [Lacunisphaera limnophila]|uniref:DUF2971 domain-containing protein n=1 Tax=Lacunisphaera limnophila TaxID=1838286 RepID=A0A1D8AX33_9BACT|nr:DUF2971 domain-containing protein [Lacunisphaera limnophila]AOS45454.1 hypothetical protein Verru16b_02535 [Lacunisphaera limnophila]
MNLKITKPPARPFLNRYTSLPVLLDILVHRQIVLLKPSSWEDRSDSFYLERYKDEKKLKTVLALCFSTKRETFHHWKVFSAGSGGVCVEFDKAMLLDGLTPAEGFMLRKVDYAFINDVVSRRPKLGDWPFLKRKPFEDEGEFRIIYENKGKEERTKAIPIQLSCIRMITLSPWLPETVAKTVTKVLKNLPGCSAIPVVRSSLLETTRWKFAINPIKTGSSQTPEIIV